MQTMYAPAVGGFAHGLAINGYQLMVKYGMFDDWELDEWQSDGFYDYNLYKPYGQSTMTVDVYDLEDYAYGFLEPITESVFTFITVTRDDNGVYTWRNHHNNYNTQENN